MKCAIEPTHSGTSLNGVSRSRASVPRVHRRDFKLRNRERSSCHRWHLYVFFICTYCRLHTLLFKSDWPFQCYQNLSSLIYLFIFLHICSPSIYACYFHTAVVEDEEQEAVLLLMHLKDWDIVSVP